MKSLARLLIIVAGAWALLADSAAAQGTLESGKQISLKDVSDGKVVVIPKWENGYFVSFDFPDGAAVPTVYLQDANGNLLTKAVVSIPDSVETVLYDAAVSAQGIVAISGSANAADGRGTGFIMYLSKAGKALQLVRTWPFTPRRLCFSANGNLWVLGFEFDDDRMEKPDYKLLRQYGRDGVMINSALPRHILSVPVHPEPVSQSFLSTFGDRVGVYINRGKEWVEVSSASGEVVGRWAGLPGAPKSWVIGAFFTGSGSVYVSDEDRGSVAAQYGTRTAHRLDKANGTWVDVKNISRRIIGMDGDSVVVSSGANEIRSVRPE